MQRKKIFWDRGKEEMYKSWSTMYREGDIVIYHYHDFDHEDNRGYDYIGKFNVEDYRRAIEELQKTGRAELTGPNYSLGMRNGDNVELIFSGVPSPSATPGGTPIKGSVREFCRIKDLLLKD